MDAIKNDNLFLSLDSLVRSGKIKSHGIALGPAIGWEDEGVMAIKRRNITCLQTVYNILEQDPGRTLFNNAKKYDLGIMVRVPDASGVLTGKVDEKTIFDKNDHRASRKKEWINEAMKKIVKMKPFLSTKGLATNYAFFVIFMTVALLLFTQIAYPTTNPTAAPLERIQNIFIGCVLSLVASIIWIAFRRKKSSLPLEHKGE